MYRLPNHHRLKYAYSNIEIPCNVHEFTVYCYPQLYTCRHFTFYFFYFYFDSCCVWPNVFNTIPERISQRYLFIRVHMGIQKVIDHAPK